MHTSVCNKYYEIAELLLDNNANANVKNRSGGFALYTAINNGDLRMVKLLLKYNADVNLQYKDGTMSLHQAVCANCADNIKTELLRILLKHGADYTIKNNDNETPEELAIATGNIEAAELLRKFSINHTILKTAEQENSIAFDYEI